jgi:arylsulfatase A-like enzyme
VAERLAGGALARAAAVALLVSAGALALGSGDGVAGTRAQRPNIVVVETDDQTLASLRAEVMPHVAALASSNATTFTQSFAAPPLCCPSRAGLLTGQYPHNHGVLRDQPGYRDLRHKRDTLPVWLNRAGYRTGFIGKYLNHYTQEEHAAPAPGFDSWYALLDRSKQFPYFDAPVSDDGHPGVAEGYLTNALDHRARRFIRQSSQHSSPFFLWLAHLAPHRGSSPGDGNCANGPAPDPRDRGTFSDEPLPRPPSYNEANVDDKPSFIQASAPLGRADRKRVTRFYRCALETLVGVDRGVGQIVRELRQSGEWDHTMLVFTDDNGLLLGEHRRKLNKFLPYEESIRVPLVVHLPPSLRGGAPAVQALDQPVANIDLAPTFLQLAHAEPCASREVCRKLDGRSLAPLLRGKTGAWPQDRGILIEVGHGHGEDSKRYPCEYEAIRTSDHLYAEYPLVPNQATGECEPSNEAELYDLKGDPLELQNQLFGDPSPGVLATRDELRARLDALRDCAGTEGPRACE